MFFSDQIFVDTKFITMSWWDTKKLSKYASSALKSAQKSIDQVLEISETGEGLYVYILS